MKRLPQSLLVAAVLAGALQVAGLPPVPALGAGAPAAQPGSVAPSPAARIAELQRAGRVAEALAALRQELAGRPGDALLLYNRACLENRLGQGEQAVASLRAALAAGYDDLAHAAGDPDLRLGEAAPRLARLLADERARRDQLSARRGARLEQGVAVTLPLEPAPGDSVADGSRVTVTWRRAHLELRLEAPDGRGRWLPAGEAAPWQRTGGLLVVLGPHAGDGSGETDDAFVFGFGLEKNAGVGAVYLPEAGGWQRVRELAPKIRGAGSDRLVIDVSIPWTAIAPYHPLVDAGLGLNVLLVGGGGEPGPRLVPARVLERAGEPRHLAARLDCEARSAASGSFAGRTSASLVRGGQVALNLVAVSAAAGAGTLALAFSDSDGNPLLTGQAAEPQAVEILAGVTRLNRALDFSRLRPGPCHVSAALTLPGGGRAEWATWLLNLGADWETTYLDAIKPLRADEQPTARYFLERIGAAAAAHRGRRDPGALATTLADLNLMLARFGVSGSLLPEEGLAPFVYPGPGGADRLCRLVLPPGRPPEARLRPVVLAGHPEADAPRLAERVLRFLAADGDGAPPRAAGRDVWPVFVIAPAVADRVDELEACLRWAGARFGDGECLLAAQLAAVAPALALAAAGQPPLAGLQLFIGGKLEPWPADRDVPPPPGGLPVTWVEFTQETAVGGGGRALGAALRERK
ncbi:hypothetical protein FJ250_10865, partial [bacterium]|nr:hypothetical protein [bacterium]